MSTSSVPQVVGVDIGGANLKYARADSVAVSRGFPMWRHPERLTDALIDDLGRLGEIDALAVTMTGELADCFVDRAIGVDHIVTQTCLAADRLGVDDVSFYGVDGQFRSADEARRDVDLVAAANWHALASFVGRSLASDALLVDIGTTTTDVIRIHGGRVATTAITDHDRLLDGSLVYVGCRRTPVCALVDRLCLGGRWANVMNELFATIDDARLVLRTVAEDAQDRDTSDSMPRTRQYAANRLARMIGLDRRSLTPEESEQLALQIVAAAKQRIGASLLDRDPLSMIVLSGHGQDLLGLPADNATCESTILQLSEKLGPEVARCAPSYAVAILYRAQVMGACD